MKISSPRPPLLPSKATSTKLFLVGSTVGPLVDSLHNQCLLAYDTLPIALPNPLSPSSAPLFCSSWVVPPLLGIAYVVLGYCLPRVIDLLTINREESNDAPLNHQEIDTRELKNKAILAVTSTAFIIKLSDFLQTHDAIVVLGGHSFMLDAQTNLGIMTVADAIQWAALDCTPVALVAASITAFGGPLSELPFVANGFWHYLPPAADYLPLNGDFFQPGGVAGAAAEKILGPGYADLALSSITGTCYFAVATDAIALGRYFFYQSISANKQQT